MNAVTESFVIFLAMLFSDDSLVATAKVVGTKTECEKLAPDIRSEFMLTPGYEEVTVRCLPVSAVAKFLKAAHCIETSDEEQMHTYKCEMPKVQ